MKSFIWVTIQYDHLIIWFQWKTINNNIELLLLSFTAHYWLHFSWGLSDATRFCLSAISLQCRSTEPLLIALCAWQLHSWRPLLPPSSSPGMKRDLSCCQTVPAPHQSIRKRSAVTRGDAEHWDTNGHTVMDALITYMSYRIHFIMTQQEYVHTARLLWESVSIFRELKIGHGGF